MGESALDPEIVRRVRAVLFLNGLRGPDVDDGAQEVQVRFLERRAEVLDPGAWACAVATRIAMDAHRRSRTRLQLVDRLMAKTRPAAHLDPDITLADAVGRALSALPPELRSTVVLRYYADLTLSEIAELTETPEGTVKSRLHRAAAALRAALIEQE